jgi:hypothetical protein
LVTTADRGSAKRGNPQSAERSWRRLETVTMLWVIGATRTDHRFGGSTSAVKDPSHDTHRLPGRPSVATPAQLAAPARKR